MEQVEVKYAPGMEQIESSSKIIKEKLRVNFDGKIVRKDLTKKIKEGANVPVYVLEFLLGQYCSSDDPEIVENGVQTVKRILADNFVRPDEAQKILSKLRKKGSHTVIDMISGTMIKVEELANALQVCLDSGAKRVLIPATSMVDFATVPPDLMSAFQLISYQSAEDAVFKALGVE